MRGLSRGSTASRASIVRTASKCLRHAVAEIVDHHRGVGRRLAASRVLAVQQAQRVALQTPAAVLTQHVAVRFAVGQQSGAVSRAADATAERVQLDLCPADLHGREQVVQQEQHLGVDGRIVTPDDFDTDLGKLAQAPLLWPFAPEHRPEVEELGDRLALVQRVLDVGTDDRCRPFRAQGQRGRVAVGEGIHFFLDDVRGLTDGAAEQLGALDNRDADLGEGVAREQLAGLLLDPLPARALVGQDIVKSSD